MQLLQQRLEVCAKEGLTRKLILPQGVDLTSSDYLGFAVDPELRARFLQRLKQESFPQGAAGSRLLRGNLTLYESTETQLANFVDQQPSLLFASCYMPILAF